MAGGLGASTAGGALSRDLVPVFGGQEGFDIYRLLSDIIVYASVHAQMSDLLRALLFSGPPSLPAEEGTRLCVRRVKKGGGGIWDAGERCAMGG